MVEATKKPAAAKKAVPAAAAPKAAAPKKAAVSGKKIKVTQIGSTIGRIDVQRSTLIGLGLNKRHRSKVLVDSPAVRGMIDIVKHLVTVEDAA